MKIQFTSQDLEGSYVPNEGNFLVRIKTVTLGTSQKGDQKLTLEFVGLGDVHGKTARNDVSLSQQSKFRVRDLFLAAGFSNEELQAGPDHADLVGRVILLKRKPRQYTASDGSERMGSTDYYQKPSQTQLEEAGVRNESPEDTSDIPF